MQGPGQVIREVHNEELDAPDTFHSSSVIVLGDVAVHLHPAEVHYHLFNFADVEPEVTILAPHRQCFYIISVGRLITIRDEAQNGSVISERKDDVVAVFANTVVCEQRVQLGIQNATLWSTCAQSQRGR